MPGAIPVVPLPTAFGVETAMTPDDKHWVALHTSTPAGQQTVFLDPVAAIQLGNELRRFGKLARSGLIPVNNGGLIGPDGQSYHTADEPDED